MKLKRFLAVILAAAFVALMFGGCITKEKRADSFLIESSLELSEAMGDMAEDEDYMSMYPQDTIGYVNNIGRGSYDDPDKAVIVSVSDGLINELLEDIGIDGLETVVSSSLKERILTSVSAIVNGMYGGSGWLAFSSILTIGHTYERPGGLDESTYVALIYEDEEMVTLTTFFVDGGNYTNASCCFLLGGEETLDALLDEDKLLENAGEIVLNQFDLPGGIDKDDITWRLLDEDEIAKLTD